MRFGFGMSLWNQLKFHFLLSAFIYILHVWWTLVCHGSVIFVPFHRPTKKQAIATDGVIVFEHEPYSHPIRQWWAEINSDSSLERNFSVSNCTKPIYTTTTINGKHSKCIPVKMFIQNLVSEENLWHGYRRVCAHFLFSILNVTFQSHQNHWNRWELAMSFLITLSASKI